MKKKRETPKEVPKETPKETPKEVENMKKECQICFESHSTNLFFKITSNCTHQPTFCKNCINQHISTHLDNKNLEINCPFEKCDQLIQDDDVKKISKELFERFDTLNLFQALSQMPEFRWCKNPKCDHGQIHLEGDVAPIITCQVCGHKTCFTHDVSWHEGSSCSDFEKRKSRSEKATKGLLDKKTKQCPKCGVRILKSGGCNHMTCDVKTCKYEFCWICLADYNEIRSNGNSSHKPTCKFYARNPENGEEVLNATEDEILIFESEIESESESGSDDDSDNDFNANDEPELDDSDNDSNINDESDDITSLLEILREISSVDNDIPDDIFDEEEIVREISRSELVNS